MWCDKYMVNGMSVNDDSKIHALKSYLIKEKKACVIRSFHANSRTALVYIYF